MDAAWGELRAALPEWVSWFCLVYPLLVGPWAWLSGRLCIAVALARSSKALAASDGGELHWTERARLWRAPRAAARASTLCFVVAAAALPVLHTGPLHRVSAVVCAGLGLLTSFAGGWFAGATLERQIRPQFGFGDLLRGTLTRLLVFFPSLLVAALSAAWLPRELSIETAWLFAIVCVLVIAGICGAGIVPARLIGLVRSPSERLRACVERAATQIGHAPRAVYEMDIGYANAFALPLINVLVFEPSLVRRLDDDELSAIAAHELAHLAEPAWVRIARASVAFLLIAPLSLIGWLIASVDVYGTLAVIAVALIIAMLWRRVSVKLESRADGAAHESPGYARALEKTYEANLAPAVLRTATTHPHLYDRLLAAGLQPDYTRPQPPPKIVVPFFAMLAMLYAYVLSPYLLAALGGDEPSQAELHLALAVNGGTPWELGRLGDRASGFNRLDDDEATRYYRAASELSPDAYYATKTIVSLVSRERCDEARSEVARQLTRGDLTTAARASVSGLQPLAANCRPWRHMMPRPVSYQTLAPASNSSLSR